MSKPVSAAAKERAAVVAFLRAEAKRIDIGDGPLGLCATALRLRASDIRKGLHLPAPRKPRKGARTRSAK
jgi:hypothetical protein